MKDFSGELLEGARIAREGHMLQIIHIFTHTTLSIYRSRTPSLDADVNANSDRPR